MKKECYFESLKQLKMDPNIQIKQPKHDTQFIVEGNASITQIWDTHAYQKPEIKYAKTWYKKVLIRIFTS